MKTYRVFWIYYGINGAEEGSTLMQAKSPLQVEEEFYRYNRPFWKDDWSIGYSAEMVKEA